VARRLRGGPRSLLFWAGYLACGWGLVFAAISFYWGSGGTLGLDTIGGSIESMGRAHDPIILVGVWVTGFMKVLGALFALALVSDWGTRLPRRLIAILGWAAAAVLTLYGGSWVLVEALVASGVVRPAEPVAWKPLLWHLYVWDMSWLVWGLLFGLAAWHFTSTIRALKQDQPAEK
jgi:Protein of unknown function (DUF3995)